MYLIVHKLLTNFCAKSLHRKIENFIRTKYESKRWVMEGPMPDPSTLSAEGDDDVVWISEIHPLTNTHC